LEGKIMKKFFVTLLERLTKRLKDDDEIIIQLHNMPQETLDKPIEEILQEGPLSTENPVASIKKEEKDNNRTKKPQKKVSTPFIALSSDPRDIMESMGIPYLALSKNRTAPIIYESPDGTTKIRITCHSEHYIASIYDWDIIQCIAGKIQEIINSGSDIPPRTVIIPRHKLLKELNKHDGKKSRKEIEASLERLKLTGIKTTIRNEDFRYKGGFGFIDSWGYTERKDIKEFRITLSDWLYDGICRQGALLKVHPEYFKMTSGLKKILYRIARKHVGTQNTSWDFSIEDLHKKTGSERDLRKFRHDLKKAVKENDLPGYFLELIEQDGQTSVRFLNMRKELKKILSQ
jgi:plasmid replication initiation protein